MSSTIRRPARTAARTSSDCAARCGSSTRSRDSAPSGCGTCSPTREWVPALGALTGGQAVQMVKAGLKAIYLSGWQVAADANLVGRHVSRPEPLPRELGPRARTADQQRAPPRRPDRARRGRRRDALARADRRRRRGGLRRPPERLRDHEGVHRGRRGRGALRGPALVGEEVRPPRRQGARPDEPVRPHARRGPAGGGRARRADARRRPHRRPLRVAPHERRRRDRPRALHRRADARGVLPGARRDRGGDRPRARVRPLRRSRLVRDLDAGHGRGGAVRGADPRAVSRQAARLQLLAVVQLAQAPDATRRSPDSSETSRRSAIGSSSSPSPASTRSTSRCSSSPAATGPMRCPPTSSCRSASSRSRTPATRPPATSARSAPATSTR